MIGHARRRHEVAFIGGVNEHAALIRVTGKGDNRHDTVAFLNHALSPVQPFLPVHGDVEFGHNVLEDPLGHMGLKHPHGAVLAVHGRHALAPVPEGFAFLPAPRLLPLVLFPDPVVKVAGQAADDRLVARIRKAEPAAGQSAQVFVRRHDHNTFAHFHRLHGGDYRRGSAAVHHHVIGLRFDCHHRN
ncbi:MAG: hypothetical protein BWX80_03624 [Candidatus Hydrogenedentes bacterium ADurb.Bin101]|nr:MAG: hypothetical protein BWX80_03624 [Candidatus Hydrogenedentes bacterium ADurb.Bin101]